MDFEEILEQWESSQANSSTNSALNYRLVAKEKAEGLLASPGSKGARSLTKTQASGYRNIPTEDELDLHGVTTANATALIEQFLSESVANGYRKVRIVHGRGIHSPAG